MRVQVGEEVDTVEGAGATAISGTDSAGRFRLQVPPLPAGRVVRFHLVLERSLTENGRRLFRQDVEALLRREMAPGRADAVAGDDRLRDGTRAARALEEGRAARTAGGELTFAAAGPFFDANATPEQAAGEFARLSRETRAARSRLEAALRRHDEAVPSLSAALAEIHESGAFSALLAGLEARPELDPRNPRSPLALSDEARALARGETPAVPRLLQGGPGEGFGAARSTAGPRGRSAS
jgi:hypothetical protein